MLWLLTLPFRILFGVMLAIVALPFAILALPFAIPLALLALPFMRAASALGATDARILHYADSGDVSGDKSSVVGYVAAAVGRFDKPDSE